MPEPFEGVESFFKTRRERDVAYNRKLEKDFMIATNQRVIKKIKRQKGKKTQYGYEVKRA